MADRTILKTISDAWSSLVGETARSVVSLESDGGAWRTGLVVSAREILTVARQAEEGEQVRVLLPGGKESSATVAGYDAVTELALLKTDVDAGVKPETVRQDLPHVGELSLTVAYPSPEGIEARSGLVRCVSERAEGRYFQTDGRMFPGFAGAPVYDAEGRLEGITALPEESGAGYCIPIADALETAKRLSEKGSTRKGYLGVRTMPAELREPLSSDRGETQEYGLVIVGVERDSPAAKAGLTVGDILVSLAGKPVADYRDLINAVSASGGQGTMEAGILRGEERKTIQVTLEARTETMSRRGGGHHGWRSHGR